MTKGNLDKILCYKEALAKIIVSVEELKMQIQKAKLEADESVEDVQKWGTRSTYIDEVDDMTSFAREKQFMHLCISHVYYDLGVA